MTKSDFMTAFSGMIDAVKGVIRSRDAACHVSTTTTLYPSPAERAGVRFTVLLLYAFLCAATMNAHAQIVDEWNISADDGVSNVTATLSGPSGDYTLTISGTGAMMDVIFSPWYNVRTSITMVIIEDGTTSIGNNAFSGCTALNSVTIGNNVISIGRNAFQDCTSLTSVVIGNSVKSIDQAAFLRCSNLVSVTIPASVETIAIDAFSSCSVLNSIDVEVDNANFRSENGVLFNKDRTTLIRYPIGKQGAYIIPYGVTSIGVNAFSGCTGLTSVTIPASVETILGNAFTGCTGLNSIEVEADNANFSSENGVLFNKDKTTLIRYPMGKQDAYLMPYGVTAIGPNAFDGCTDLTSVTIPTSVKSIGAFAFRGCTNLTSATIPNSVTSIDSWAFNGCSGLTSVIIPNGVITIQGFTFQNCTSLTNLVIGNSVTSIGGSAFGGCTSLKSVVIPASVENISDFAFGECTSLTEVIVHAVTPQIISPVAFDGVTRLTLHVPDGSVDAYKAAAVWQNFGNIVAIEEIVYTVTFDSQGGSAVAQQIVEQGYKATQPADPTLAGRIFSGWYKEPGSINAWNFSEELTDDITLYAKWTALFTVAFDTQGGNAVAQQIVEQDGNVTQPADPTRAGHIFSGWYKEANSINAWNFADELTANVTLYAKWTALFTVAFDTQGGNVVASQIVEQGGNATQPADPTRTGFIFNGWYKDASGNVAWNFSTDAVIEAITLYAKWTETGGITNLAAEVFIPNLNVFPNPFTGEIRILGADGCTLQIINTAGAIVHAQMITNSDETIGLEHLPAGVYVFRFEKDGKVQTERVVKN